MRGLAGGMVPHCCGDEFHADPIDILSSSGDFGGLFFLKWTTDPYRALRRVVTTLEMKMDIQNAYNEWSGTYDSDENLTRDLDRRVTVDLLGDLHFDSILEVGCGTGKNTVFLAQIASVLYAVDFSRGMLEKAKQKVQAENVLFSMMDITRRWEFEDQSCDLVTCNLVLEHIENISFVVGEAARVLQPNGYFLINELHPFRQYDGKKARFQRNEQTVEVDAFVHHISDFYRSATEHGLVLTRLNEYWHEADQNKPPRIISLLFEKRL
jgi:malonyl-CoA O-methyltransferase